MLDMGFQVRQCLFIDVIMHSAMHTAHHMLTCILHTILHSDMTLSHSHSTVPRGDSHVQAFITSTTK